MDSIDFGSTDIRRMPVYFLIGCGDTMAGAAIQALETGVQQLHNEMLTQPQAQEMLNLSVITFSDGAEQLVPLTPIDKFAPPSLSAAGGHDLGAGFKVLNQALQDEMIPNTPTQKGDFKAVVFLLTDCKPTDDWQPTLNELRATSGNLLGSIIAIGSGDGVDRAILEQITSSVMLIRDVSAENLSAFFLWASQSVSMASESRGDTEAISQLPPEVSELSELPEMPVEGKVKIEFSDGGEVFVEAKPFDSKSEGDLYYSDDKKYVVKLFNEGRDTADLREKLEKLIGEYNLISEDSTRAPFFSWPEAIVETPRLGFCMPTVGGKSLDHYVNAPLWKNLPANEKGNWLTRAYLAYQIARIARWMHTRGLFYPRLSPGDLAVDIKTGQVTLMNCDQILIPGQTITGRLRVAYSAPEVNMKNVSPSVATDQHTLAVLIYQILLLRHPLQGPKVHSPEPEQDEKLAYGEKALYIENPTDTSNRPDRLTFTTEMLTPLMRNFFQCAFVDGLHDPAKRPTAVEWEAALLKMADQIILCSNPDCVMRAYVVHDKHRFSCPWCKTPYQSALELPIISLYKPGVEKGKYVEDNWSVVGWPNRALAMYHIDPKKLPEPGDPTSLGAHFELDDAGTWYFVNDALEDARTVSGKDVTPFKPGARIPLTQDLKILMGPKHDYRAGFVSILETAAKTIQPTDKTTHQSWQEVYAIESASTHYSEPDLWEKIKQFAKRAGTEVIEKVLILYYAAQSPDTPAWAKGLIYGALGYFILPVDAIPDAIPVVGFSDDLGVLVGALGAVAMSITPEIKALAKKKMSEWFNDN